MEVSTHRWRPRSRLLPKPSNRKALHGLSSTARIPAHRLNIPRNSRINDQGLTFILTTSGVSNLNPKLAQLPKPTSQTIKLNGLNMKIIWIPCKSTKQSGFCLMIHMKDFYLWAKFCRNGLGFVNHQSTSLRPARALISKIGIGGRALDSHDTSGQVHILCTWKTPWNSSLFFLFFRKPELFCFVFFVSPPAKVLIDTTKIPMPRPGQGSLLQLKRMKFHPWVRKQVFETYVVRQNFAKTSYSIKFLIYLLRLHIIYIHIFTYY